MLTYGPPPSLPQTQNLSANTCWIQIWSFHDVKSTIRMHGTSICSSMFLKISDNPGQNLMRHPHFPPPPLQCWWFGTCCCSDTFAQLANYNSITFYNIAWGGGGWLKKMDVSHSFWPGLSEKVKKKINRGSLQKAKNLF